MGTCSGQKHTKQVRKPELGAVPTFDTLGPNHRRGHCQLQCRRPHAQPKVWPKGHSYLLMCPYWHLTVRRGVQDLCPNAQVRWSSSVSGYGASGCRLRTGILEGGQPSSLLSDQGNLWGALALEWPEALSWLSHEPPPQEAPSLSPLCRATPFTSLAL